MICHEGGTKGGHPMERLNQIQKRTALEQARDVMAIPLAAIATFFYVVWQLVAE
jgi:hypothetical protein